MRFWKRVLVFSLLVTALCALLCLCASAETYSGSCAAPGDGVMWSLDTSTGVLNIFGAGEMASFEFTYYSGQYTTTAPWRQYASYVKTVTIGNGVTSIGEGAFNGCTSLTSMTVPFVGATKGGTTNTHIGYIFGAPSCGDNCLFVPSSLKEVVVTGGNIGNSAFYDCPSLTNVTIGNSVTSIGYSAFYGCTSLTSITIPDSVTSIGDYAFYGCTSLTSITIPDGVTSIGYYAFSGCASLTSVTIGNSITSVGGYVFYDCKCLTNVTIGNGVTGIGYGEFYGCTSLTSITIPDSVTSIGDYAFYGCTSLTSITIPDGVTSIGYYAFYNCTSLTSIYCQADSEPSGWSSSWRYGCNAKVYWGEKWLLNNGVLRVGALYAGKAYPSFADTPWAEYATEIRAVSIQCSSDGVNVIAFNECYYVLDWFLKDSVMPDGLEPDAEARVHFSSVWTNTEEGHIHTCANPDCRIVDAHDYDAFTGICSICGMQNTANELFTFGGKLYYRENGIVQTNFWQIVNGKMYYAGADGVILCENQTIDDVLYLWTEENGLVEATYHFETVGGVSKFFYGDRLITGWFEFESKTYYASKTTGVVMMKDGKIGGKQYLWSEQKGLYLADGICEVGGKFYCYKLGMTVTGWRHADGSDPYVVDGISEQYSSNPDGLYYFLSTTGEMITSATYRLGGYDREFNADHSVKPLNGMQAKSVGTYYYVNGTVYTGWYTDTASGLTYYFQASDAVYGQAATKWMYIANKIYYFKASTSTNPYSLMTSGKIGGISYTYDTTSALGAGYGSILYNGFVNIDYANAMNSNTAANIQKKNATTRYYVNGVAQTGWQQISGKWYYFFADGSAYGSFRMCLSKTQRISGVSYVFDDNGVCTNK